MMGTSTLLVVVVSDRNVGLSCRGPFPEYPFLTQVVDKITNLKLRQSILAIKICLGKPKDLERQCI